MRNIEKAYLSDKKCVEFSKHKAHVIREELENGLKNFNYFTGLNDR